MINSYGYAVFKQENGNFPLHIVEIKSNIYRGFCVFNCARHAQEFIAKQKKSIINLIYDSDFKFSKYLLDAYTKTEIDGLFSKIESKQVFKF